MHSVGLTMVNRYCRNNSRSTTFLENWILDPTQWGNDTPACGGAHQSPINFDSTTAIFANYSPVNFVNYDKIYQETITNNGYTGNYIIVNFHQVFLITFLCAVKLQLQAYEAGDDLPYIMDGGMTDKYNFYELHFHWGSDNRHGSEHQIDGKR